MKNQQGFTLIEMLVVSALTVAIGGAILGLSYTFGTSQLAIWRDYQDVDQANMLIESFVRELRTARYSDAGSYPIADAQDNQIIFYSDIDFDGSAERVRYTFDGSTLTKGIIKPVGFPVTYPTTSEVVRVMSTNVRNGTTAMFTYYNSSWPASTAGNPVPLATRQSQTRTVRMYVRLNVYSGDPNHDYILDSAANIRILRREQ